MIIKSYLVEENLENLKNNLVLFYGENIGLLNELREKLNRKFNKKVIKFSQIDILKSQDNFLNEIKNTSLFHDQKIFIIHSINDKILSLINNICPDIGNNKIYLFAEVLEKKSKIRSFFEKEKNVDVVPCYLDNEITIKKIILLNFKEYVGLSTNVVNTLLNVCGNDRSKLHNEIEKIKIFFKSKKINENQLLNLLNLTENQDFYSLRDSILNGNLTKTNFIISSFIVESEKISFYLSIINYRLKQIYEVKKNKVTNIETAISKLKPAIFWKDKPDFIKQLKNWNKNKIKLALEKTYSTELKIKSNSHSNSKILLKKLLVDICLLANVSSEV